MILLIDNYDSFTYNLYQYFEELGAHCKVYRNDALNLGQIKRMKPEQIVISPGPGTPDTAGISADVIRKFAGQIPILGVCLGHQTIGQVFGGKVIRAKTLMHGKLSEVYHQQKGVFQGLPSPFSATRYHSLVVQREGLPETLEITAETSDSIIMGLSHRDYAIHGVQFHPESILTSGGKEMLKNFLAIR